MSYEQQNWVTGNRITAEKLNHVEEGIASGGSSPLIVKLNVDTLDKTWQEIYDAFPNVVFDDGNAEGGMYQRNAIEIVKGFGNEYLVAVRAGVGDVVYKATSTSGYPKEDVS